MIVAYRRIVHPMANDSNGSTSPPDLPSLWSPVLPADLGGVMNDNARLSSPQPQSNASSARKCAGRLPLLLIFYTYTIWAKPNSYQRGTVDDQPLRALSQDLKESVL